MSDRLPMSITKPEVVAYHHVNIETPQLRGVSLFHDPSGYSIHNRVEPLIRLSDYEALQAECEKLRKDAERYRFLRDAEELPMNLMRLEMIGDVMDSAVDAALAAHRKGGEA